MKLSFGKCWGLLFFDIIGLAISGYAFLLGYQVIQTLPSANAYIILMAFFVGIKVIVLALYDLNRNMLRKNIPFIGGSLSILGNGIIFVMCFFLIPEVPLPFFIGLIISDFLIITLCHFLWWILIGKDDDYPKEEKISAKEARVAKKENKKLAPKEVKNKKQQEPLKADKNPEKKGKRDKKTWLSRDEEESEYDSIFTSLLENEKKGQQRFVGDSTINEPRVIEDEKRYQTSDFLNEIKENLKKETKLPPNRTEAQSDNVRKSIKQDLHPVSDVVPVELPSMASEQKKEAPIEANLIMNNQSFAEPVKVSSQIPILEAINPVTQQQERNDIFGDLPTIKEKKTDFQKMETLDFNPSENIEPEMDDNEEGFLSIERRLGYLFHEIEKSMKETQYLQGAISDFQKEVENYEPIAGDEKIVAAGNLIREKLKMIIDKQFVVDEVLDDLIRLSKLINKRINDLDIIEVGLNQRKIALDQKDLLLVEARNRNMVDKEIEILPEEVLLENQDSEFIVVEGDYESIRKYLTENPEE